MKQSEKNPKAQTIKNILSTTGLVLVAAFLGALSSRVGWVQFFQSWPEAPLSSAAELPSTKDLSDPASQAETLNTVLAIVQGYYVDQERVGLKPLFLGALKGLARTYDYRVESEAQSLILRRAQSSHNVDIRELDSLVGFRAQLLGIEEWLGRPKNFIETWSQAILASLDPHSVLMSANDYRELRQGTEGSFGGLGIVVGMRDQLLTVLKPIPSSPATRAGILKNDKILSINDNHTYGHNLDHLVEFMRGPPGSVVKLSLLREGEPWPRRFELKRELIKVHSVESEIRSLDRGAKALWLTLDSFAAHAAQDIDAELKRHAKKLGPELKGLILDLRNNPGGLLDQAVAVCDLFLSQGKIVSTRGRRQEIEEATRDFREWQLPMVVLMNADSASASEIVAGALQDHGRAIVIGQPSFGKGSVQTLFELPEERALKLTVARYYTPKDRSIQNIGISPDLSLQTVDQKKLNTNLLGSARYKNEGFLAQHLETQKSSAAEDPYHARLKYYVLSPGKEEANALDLELKAAELLLNQVPEKWQALEAGRWLSHAKPALDKVFLPEELKALSWLKNNHKITWQASALSQPQNLSGVEMMFGGSGRLTTAVEAGKEFSLPWLIRNNSQRTLERVSIFLTSASGGVNSSEILLGQLKPQSELRGWLKSELIAEYLEQSAEIYVGLSQDGEIAYLDQEPRTIVLKAKERPKVDLGWTYEDGHLSRLKDTLEVGEAAQVLVSIKNDSALPLSGVRVQFKNLSGSQVRIDEGPIEVGEINPHQELTVPIKLVGESQLHDKDLNLGVNLRSEKSNVNIYSQKSFRAHPMAVNP